MCRKVKKSTRPGAKAVVLNNKSNAPVIPIAIRADCNTKEQQDRICVISVWNLWPKGLRLPSSSIGTLRQPTRETSCRGYG